MMDLNKLSDKDLALLLDNLEQEDEELYADVMDIEQNIVKEDALDFVDTSEEDHSDITDITSELSKYSKEKAKILTENRSKYRIKIQRLAINQNVITLSDVIQNYDLQALIQRLTEKQVTISNRAKTSANMRLKRLINSLIPIQIRRLYNMYPWVVKRCPGFTYMSTYTGRIVGDTTDVTLTARTVSFWATPDIPYFFKQGTEQNILESYRSDMLYLVDNAINLYHKYQVAQENKALGIATRLIKNRVRTYFDLLTYNPYWFELLYNIIKDAETNNT